jgi:hypothetical protein
MPAKTPPMLTQPTRSDTRCAALFASSGATITHPDSQHHRHGDQVRPAAVRPTRLPERTAQQFGDHPEATSPNARADDLCAAARAGSAIVGRAESACLPHRGSGSTSVICPIPAQARSRRSSYVKTGTERSCLFARVAFPAAAGCRAAVRRRRQPCGRACPRGRARPGAGSRPISYGTPGPGRSAPARRAAGQSSQVSGICGRPGGPTVDRMPEFLGTVCASPAHPGDLDINH